MINVTHCLIESNIIGDKIRKQAKNAEFFMYPESARPDELAMIPSIPGENIESKPSAQNKPELAIPAVEDDPGYGMTQISHDNRISVHERIPSNPVERKPALYGKRDRIEKTPDVITKNSVFIQNVPADHVPSCDSGGISTGISIEKNSAEKPAGEKPLNITRSESFNSNTEEPFPGAEKYIGNPKRANNLLFERDSSPFAERVESFTFSSDFLRDAEINESERTNILFSGKNEYSGDRNDISLSGKIFRSGQTENPFSQEIESSRASSPEVKERNGGNQHFSQPSRAAETDRQMGIILWNAIRQPQSGEGEFDQLITEKNAAPADILQSAIFEDEIPGKYAPELNIPRSERIIRNSPIEASIPTKPVTADFMERWNHTFSEMFLDIKSSSDGIRKKDSVEIQAAVKLPGEGSLPVHEMPAEEAKPPLPQPDSTASEDGSAGIVDGEKHPRPNGAGSVMRGRANADNESVFLTDENPFSEAPTEYQKLSGPSEKTGYGFSEIRKTEAKPVSTHRDIPDAPDTCPGIDTGAVEKPAQSNRDVIHETLFPKDSIAPEMQKQNCGITRPVFAQSQPGVEGEACLDVSRKSYQMPEFAAGESEGFESAPPASRIIEKGGAFRKEDYGDIRAENVKKNPAMNIRAERNNAPVSFAAAAEEQSEMYFLDEGVDAGRVAGRGDVQQFPPTGASPPVSDNSFADLMIRGASERDGEINGDTAASNAIMKTGGSVFEGMHPERLSGARDCSGSTPLESAVMDAIVRQARFMLVNRRSTATIILEPPSLGRLRLEIVTENSKVMGKIFVESSETRDIIRNHIQELHQNLFQNGFRVEPFDVHMGLNDGRDGWARREHMENAAVPFQTERNPASDITVDAVATAEHRRSRTTGALGYIDVWM